MKNIISGNKVRVIMMSAAVAVPLLLSACSMAVPTHVSQNKARVVSSDYTLQMPAHEIGNDELKAIGQHYRRFGSGSALVTVTYDTHSRVNSAANAAKELARINGKLKSEGIDAIKGNILPVKDQGDISLAYLSYTKTTASGPEDCEMMPGAVGGTDPEVVKDYAMGCSTEMLFARQIARPADLMGREGSGVVDGRRAANVLDPYLAGVPNKALAGESASGN